MKIHTQNRIPKLPEINKSIIEKIANVNVVETKSDINKISISKAFSYKASDGDIVKKRMFDNISVVEIDIDEKNINSLELICETNINSTPTTSRRIIKLEGNLCDVATITLGYYRKYENDFLALNAKGIRQTYEQNNKIVYQSLIKCSPENKELVLNLIRSLKIPMIEQF